MKKYIDIEQGTTITATQLFTEYLRAHKEQRIDNGMTFAWYIHNSLTVFGGTLREIREN